MLICHLFNSLTSQMEIYLRHYYIKIELKVKDSNSTPLRSMEDIQQCAYQTLHFYWGFESFFHDLIGTEWMIINHAVSWSLFSYTSFICGLIKEYCGTGYEKLQFE